MIQKRTSNLPELARFLDSRFRGPFGFSFGWDGILSFVPGIGDLFSSSVSFYILYRAAVLGCPSSVLMRMALNSALEAMLNSIPGLGILSDFVWKANVKNVQLVEAYLQNPRETRVRSRLALLLVAAIILAGFAASIWGIAILLSKLRLPQTSTWS